MKCVQNMAHGSHCSLPPGLGHLRWLRPGLCIFPVAAPGLLTSRVNVSLAIVGPVMFAKTLKQLVQLQACPERGSCAGKTPRRPRVGDGVTPAFPSVAASSVVAAATGGKAGAVHVRTETRVSDGVENKQGIILKLPCPVLCWGSRWAGTSRVQLLQTQVFLVRKLSSNPGLLRGYRPVSGLSLTGQTLALGRGGRSLDSAPGLGWEY